MLRKITAIILVLSVITANFSKLFIYASFELNKHYIVSELCENRDKPLMHCEGQCYLSKKLEQAHKKEKNQQQESQRYHFQEACITEKLVWVSQVQLLKMDIPHEISFRLPSCSSFIFQPPRV